MRAGLAFVLGNSMSNLKRKESSSLLAFLPAKKAAIADYSSLSTSKEWECSTCTYLNAVPLLACEMCHTPLSSLARKSLAKPSAIPAAKALDTALETEILLVKEPESTVLPRNFEAEALAAALEAGSATPGAVKPTYLTNGGDSWYILARGYWPSPDQARFDEQWELHPEDFHKISMFGRTVSETRWSTAWGRSYAYAGTMNPVRPILPEQGGAMVAALLERTNTLLSATSHPSTSSSVCDRKSKSSSNANNNAKSQAHGGSNGANNPSNAYNGCLQNWYMPEHCIGLHADDEKCMRADVPIFSLSWGGPRRFLFRAKAAYLPSSVDTASKSSLPASKATAAKVELILRDGDLLVMGGTCQKTHKHEVPKLRKTMDLPTGRRINWTIRAFC